VLTSPGVLPKFRRKLLLALIGSFPALAADKLGSRVADTAWAAADGFMKEKIARSLVPHATTLGNDMYGKYVVRKMDLHLLLRRPDEWRQAHLGVKHHFAHQKEQEHKAEPVAAAVAVAEGETDETEDKKRKKDRKRERDAIDDVFAEAKKSKRAEA
jgi:nucleolar protein 9